MTPFYEALRVSNGKVFKVTFEKECKEYSAVVEGEDGFRKDCGKWPSISDADTFANMVIADCSNAKAEAEAGADPLAEHRSRGAVLAVGIDNADKKYSIIAGYKPWRWEDTGLRFDTDEEARKVVDEHKRTGDGEVPRRTQRR